MLSDSGDIDQPGDTSKREGAAPLKQEITKSAGAMLSSAWQIFLSLLVAVYFLLVIVQLCPEVEWRTRLWKPLAQFWNYWQLEQSWNLFAPNPHQDNLHPTAIITFEDGTKTIWELPRMNKLSLSSRFRDEKWRKWSMESLPNNKEFWPDVARYIGRRFYTAENKPVSVSLNMWSANIPPPSPKNTIDKLPFQTNFVCFFVYRYTPEDYR
jgi:hypothetical protein